MSYFRFAAMILTSTVVMFIMMYLNTYAWEHVYYSETRTYMAIYMGAMMAIIMLSFMLNMYKKTAVNIGIFVGAAIVFAGSLWLLRSQEFVSGSSYMRAMIPHHSIAILTSERAQIEDSRVRKLADEIIAAQRREIAEMKYLIAALEEGEGVPDEIPGERPDEDAAGPPEVVSLEEALEANVVATLDPSSMEPEELAAVLPGGGGCSFHLTSESPPLLAVGRAGAGLDGVLKLNGKLVRVSADAADPAAILDGARLGAGDLSLAVDPVPDAEFEEGDGIRRIEADLVFTLKDRLTVGYRGFVACA